jgi:hypothetical protein
MGKLVLVSEERELGCVGRRASKGWHLTSTRWSQLAVANGFRHVRLHCYGKRHTKISDSHRRLRGENRAYLGEVTYPVELCVDLVERTALNVVGAGHEDGLARR